MADKENRTEEATPRRKSKLRGEGKIPKSQDLSGAVVLVAVATGIGVFAPSIGRDLQAYALRSFRFQDLGEPTQAVAALLPVIQTALLPLLIIGFLAAVSVGTVQTRGFFSLKMLQPKMEKFNPIPGLKKILPGKEAAIELGKNFLKLIAVGAVVVKVILDSISRFSMMPSMHPAASAAFVGSVAAKVALYGSIAFAIVAMIDWYHQKKKFQQDSKMAKEDVKDEHKQMEGDPKVKSKLRHRARELSGRRAVADTAGATVVVTNPTHISVALRYETDTDFAPVVLAKGVDEIALKMREVARKKGIPIVENKPLARAMYADVKTGHPIPVELYSAVAEIIAHVLRLKGAMVA